MASAPGTRTSRGDTARRVVAVGLAIATAVCLFLGLRNSTGADAATRVASMPRTPVWSPRRVPQTFVDAVGAVNLQAALDRLTTGTDSCFRVDVAGMGTIARHGEATPVIPASTEKILNAAGSLDVLGPGATFTTAAVASGPVASAPVNGAIDRLWLVGGGDPVLSTPEWTAQREAKSEYTGLTGSFTQLSTLADAIVAAGVRFIPGGVVGDGSRYSTPSFLPTWADIDRTEVGPLGALVVDDGFDLTTGMLTPDPALAAAATLSGMLTARGVVVGPPATGTAPAGSTEIASIHSAALDTLVTEMLSASDNATAERLALAVGYATTGSGTTAAGIAGITGSLQKAGIDLTGVSLVDASGLSPQNRITCNALIETLGLGGRPRSRAVTEGLSIAAKRGTLRDRFVGTPLAGHLYGKTGTLGSPGVAGLAGLFDVNAGTGTPLFASVFNGGFSRAEGTRLTTAAAEAVDAYPQSPPAAVLVPLP